MNIQVQDINSIRKNIVATFTAEEIQAQESSILNEFAAHAKVPGFRPGKAPTAVVQKNYAKGIKDEARRKLVQSAYEKATKDNGLKIALVVEVKDADLDQTATCEIVVDTVPAFTLPEYKGIEVTVASEEVTDQDVQKAIDGLLNQRAEYKVVERDVCKGDFAKINYDGSIDGKPISEIAPAMSMYGKQNGTWEEAGTEGPGVSSVINGIIGMKKGERKEVTHVFPADFENKDLAGKTASYFIEVLEIREKTVPPMDEAFFKSNKVKDEAELRENLQKNLAAQKKNQNMQSRRSQILEKLGSSVEFDLPQSVVDSESQELVDDFVNRQMRAYGASRADFTEHQAEIKAGAEKTARERVKLQYIVLAIADAEKITVTNDDMYNVLVREAMARGLPINKVIEEIKKDQFRLTKLQRAVLVEKTIAFVSENAKVVDKK